ncbi:MAG: hypothetical protein Q9166_005282 [cf. Caloplaca sp. 2 TL-2023]
MVLRILQLLVASKPADTDEFVVVHDKNIIVNIDVALNGLINAGPKNTQNDAMRALISNVDQANPPVVQLLHVRLRALVKHVGKDLKSFLAMALNGTFSKSENLSSTSLLAEWWPEMPGLVTLEDSG